MSIKMDLSQFKHLESDDKSTTLQHKQGHVLKLAHGGLAKASIDALKALAQKAIESDTAEDGVEEAEKKRKEGKGSKYGETILVNKKDKKDYGKVTGPDGEKPSVFAQGGEVQRYADGGEVDDQVVDQQPMSTPEIPPALAATPQASPIDAFTQGLPSETNPIAMPAPKDPIVKGSIDEYNTRIKAQGVDGFGTGMIGPNGEAPAGGINTNLWDMSKAYAQDKVMSSQNEQNAKQESQAADLAKQNAIRAELGQPLLPDPNAQAPQQAMTEAPATAQGAEQQAMPVDPNAGVANGFQTQLAGINKQAEAQAQLGQEQSAILQQQQEANAAAQQTFQEQMNEIDNDTKAYQQDIKNGYVDPNKYWTGYTAANGDKVPGHSRVAAGIGMILAGFGGLQGAQQVQSMVQNQINQSIDAQKTNLNSSHNLLRANLDRFKNLKDATDMTRVMMNENFMSQLQAAAAKAQGPMAKAAAMQAIGPLQRENAQLQTKIALNQSISRLASGKNPQALDKAIDMLEQYDPARAKEMKARMIPGLGLANTPEGAKDLREMQTTVKTVKDSIGRLREIAKQGGKSMSPNLTKEAEGIRTQLIGRLRVPLTGPGAMSEGERELLASAIPDVTAMFSLDSRNNTALNTLEKGILSGYKNMAVANGLNIPREQQVTSSRQQQAEAWLKSNPNHPDAPAIRKSLGMK